MRGYIHIYTGNGKGKTTAALGLSLRAVCAGKKVFVGQFVKGMKYSELKADNYLPNFEIQQFGRSTFIKKEASQADIDAATKGLKICREILADGKYDLVILDELNIALYYRLFTLGEVIKMLKNRAAGVEVVITGRYAPEELIEMADLVSEIEEIKHYYQEGVDAREGIEL